MSEQPRQRIGRAFEMDYQPPEPGFRDRLRGRAREAQAAQGRPHWALPAGAAALALLLVVCLTVSGRLPRSPVLPAVQIGDGSGSQPPPPNPTPDFVFKGVRAVRPVSSQSAWVVANGFVYVTADAGATWLEASPPGAPADSVQALSRSEAWVATVPTQHQFFAFHTSDGGLTWTRSGPLQGLGGQFFFVDTSHGWLYASQGYAAGSEGAILYRTSDAGVHWEQVAATSTGESGPIPFGCHKLAPSFADVNHGWLGLSCSGAPYLLATGDGGTTWSRQYLPVPAGYFTVEPPIFFTDLDGVTAVTEESPAGVQFLVSHDRGLSWQPAGSVHDGQRPAVLSLADWLVIVGGRLQVTHDGGHSWAEVPAINLEVGSVRLVLIDPATGWAYVPLTFALYRTADGGRTWSRVALPGS